MKQIFTLYCLLLLRVAVAQPVSWEATYDFRLDLGLEQNYRAVLQGRGSLSLFRWGSPVSIQQESDAYEFHLTPSLEDGIGSYTYTDMEGNQMISGIPHFNGERYLLCEPVPDIPWQLHPGSRQIGPFQCQKATADFRGRSYEVWFAPEIPLRAGPWKLFGLPGLVVQAQDQAGEISFRLRRFSQNELKIEQPEPADACMDIDTFAALQKKMAGELIRRMNAKLPRGSRVSLGRTNTMERFDR